MPVALLKSVAGLQVKVLAPVAVNVAEFPAQIVAEFTVITGVDTTVTVDVAVAEQVPAVPVTVYTAVVVGVAVTVAPVVALKSAGFCAVQVYELAPLTVNVVVWPAQMVSLFTVRTGLVVVLTLAVAVVVHEFASETETV